MRLRHIEVFHAVYTCGSVSQAAKTLNVSQPSVSKTLRHAESNLGYLLFQRLKGKMVPTKEAHILFEEVKELNTQLALVQNRARNLKNGKSGHIRVAAMPAIGLNLLPRAIAAFRSQNPDITFDISTIYFKDILTSLKAQQYDIALAFNPPRLHGFSEYTIGCGELMCMHKTDAFPTKKTSLALSDLEDHEVISIKDSGPLSQILSTQIQINGIELNSSISAQTYYIAKQLVEYGSGLAIVDHLTAMSGSTSNVRSTPLEPALKYDLKALYGEDQPLSQTCTNFLGFFREIYTEHYSVTLPDAL